MFTKEEREEITKENMNLIYDICHSFNNTTGVEFEELFSVANIGFTKALNSYKEDKGAKFTTYAYSCMRNELSTFVASELKYKENINKNYSVEEYGTLPK